MSVHANAMSAATKSSTTVQEAPGNCYSFFHGETRVVSLAKGMVDKFPDKAAALIAKAVEDADAAGLFTKSAPAPEPDAEEDIEMEEAEEGDW